MSGEIPPTYFLDSSAIAKRYIEEPGSAWVESLCVSTIQPVIALAQFSVVEVAAAFAARRRNNQLDPAEYEEVLDEFLSDQRRYSLVAADQVVIDTAIQLTRRQRLRGCDAIQLASALSLHQALLKDGLPGITFVCADDDLLIAAAGEGLATENPNLHP
ncbi:MAG: type II toxin-antitoxin system VapC family toxin [Chloroflexota bacterium]|nr:type II toxin-antitoxin system VapC family toxin [Chloroflexota bacterium]